MGGRCACGKLTAAGGRGDAVQAETGKHPIAQAQPGGTLKSPAVSELRHRAYAYISDLHNPTSAVAAEPFGRSVGFGHPWPAPTPHPCGSWPSMARPGRRCAPASMPGRAVRLRRPCRCNLSASANSTRVAGECDLFCSLRVARPLQQRPGRRKNPKPATNAKTAATRRPVTSAKLDTGPKTP